MTRKKARRLMCLYYFLSLVSLLFPFTLYPPGRPESASQLVELGGNGRWAVGPGLLLACILL